MDVPTGQQNNISLVLKKLSIPCIQNKQGDYLTPLTRACMIGESAYEAAEYLLTQHANPNGSEQVIRSLLWTFTCLHIPRFVSNCTPHFTQSQGHIKPLSAAVGSGCEQLIEILLASGAHVNSKDKASI